MSEVYKITLMKGDGIGPEVVDAAVSVMDKAASIGGFSLEYEECLIGGAAIDSTGKPLPEETVASCKSSDAVLLGAVGGPKWDTIDPSIRPERALLGIRKELGLFANLRPAVMFDELADASPVKNAKGMDLLIVRELIGGIYFGDRGTYDCIEKLPDGTPFGKVSYDTESYSQAEIRRIVKAAFTYASGRRKHLTLVDKANVMESSRLWRTETMEIAKSFPDVTLDFLYVDNCSMQLIGRPASFDVIVTSNIFGDILSDEAGMITGSIGLLPSASLGDPGKPGLYEPVHGSAPDIAGTGKANPIATILSAAMLLRWSLGKPEAADLIEDAVRSVIRSGFRTADIASQGENYLTTEQMTAKILEALK
ncbi:MAG: 3-isopropylmalate dehydrogenase [Clostridiales bacterium]|nr:3-isopropylmalate dehydrogenase [Clostridiales bacterium]